MSILLEAVSMLLVLGVAGYDANDFAVEVVEYVEGDGVGVDGLSGQPFNDPNTALGRPTLETTGDGWYIPADEDVPVVPVYPAWRSFEVVTVGGGGELVLRFNHGGGADENNPYGIDFIMFGNARWGIAGGGSWGPGSDPETVTVGTTFYKELGIVAVSQDGDDWYELSTGPYADDFAATAGYRWDDVNDEWGQELDPTRPVDPNLTASDFDGNSVAEIIEIYDGSAGGAGFDIKGLDANDYTALAVDSNTGQRWIQYVRIEDDPCSPGTPEVDAVSDVSCCGDYRHEYPAGDLNADCRVNLFDFAIVAVDWNDMSDVAEVTDNWLECSWECE